jgi:hypothetical protein
MNFQDYVVSEGRMYQNAAGRYLHVRDALARGIFGEKAHFVCSLHTIFMDKRGKTGVLLSQLMVSTNKACS